MVQFLVISLGRKSFDWNNLEESNGSGQESCYGLWGLSISCVHHFYFNFGSELGLGTTTPYLARYLRGGILPFIFDIK